MRHAILSSASQLVPDACIASTSPQLPFDPACCEDRCHIIKGVLLVAMPSCGFTKLNPQIELSNHSMCSLAGQTLSAS